MLLGSLVHPRERLDVGLHGRFNFLDHLQGLFLGLRAEILRGISLSQGFPEIIVDIIGTALPARPQLLTPGQRFAIKIEVLLHKCGGEMHGIGVHQFPSQIGLPRPQVFFLQFCIHAFEEAWSNHIQ